MQTILAVDDEYSVRKSYELVLGGTYRLLLAENAVQAFELLEQHHVDLIILDLILPGITGLDFLARLEEQGEIIPVIVVTASNNVQTAVDVMKRGARDFVVKPFDVDELLRLADRVLCERRKQRELLALRERDAAGFEQIIGDAPALLGTLAKARQAMQVDSTVLITGESGTGKDLIARAIHCGGKRADGPFVPISCCAIPEQLVESELFGHVKGAFTGAMETRVGKLEVADGGTLFLDEIGEMPLDAQVKLLRVLQDGCFYPVGASKTIHVDLRVICATNRNLQEAVREGRFREDLFYRVNVLQIEMPPLRKRREDIPRLAAHFIAQQAPHLNARCTALAPKALARLASYSWPGNVRELENTIQRLLVIHSAETVLQAEHLEEILPGSGPEAARNFEEFEGLPLEEAVNRLERHLILRALDRANFVQSQAADLLGTTRRILKYKMDHLGISAPSEPDSLAG